jgi:hypothetical protein
MLILVSTYVAPCSLVDGYQYIGGECCLNFMPPDGGDRKFLSYFGAQPFTYPMLHFVIWEVLFLAVCNW